MQDLRALIVGDEVMVCYPNSVKTVKKLAKIERVTATQIIIKTERFNRDSGEKIGQASRFHRPYVRVPTQQDRQEIGELIRKSNAINLFKERIKTLSPHQNHESISLLNPHAFTADEIIRLTDTLNEIFNDRLSQNN